MKLQDLLRHIADNVENGRERLSGLIWSGPNAVRRVLTEPECFSLAPRTHDVNGFTVPAPEVEALTKGQKYFFGYGKLEEWFGWYFWRDDCMDRRMLNGKNVFLTPEAAIANAKAMLGIDPYSEGEK